MTIDSIISAAEAKARELQEAIEALNAATEEAHGFCVAAGVVQSVEGARAAITGTRKRVAMAKRPKGVAVSLVGTGFNPGPPESGEAVRRTASTVYVRVDSRDKQYPFTVDSGWPSGPKAVRCTWLRISAADLDRIRAMPVGENEVSRALKAAEAVR